MSLAAVPSEPLPDDPFAARWRREGHPWDGPSEAPEVTQAIEAAALDVFQHWKSSAKIRNARWKGDQRRAFLDCVREQCLGDDGLPEEARVKRLKASIDALPAEKRIDYRVAVKPWRERDGTRSWGGVEKRMEVAAQAEPVPFESWQAVEDAVKLEAAKHGIRPGDPRWDAERADVLRWWGEQGRLPRECAVGGVG